MKTIKKVLACVAVVAIISTTFVSKSEESAASELITVQSDPGGGVGHTTN